MGKKSRIKHVKRDQSWEPDYSEFEIPKTEEQKQFLQAISDNDITIGVGCAGTGKTMLSVYAALQALDNQQVSRLIITRPVVEAGERLGYLPGTFQEKLDPYLQPMYNSLYELAGPGRLDELKRTEVIKIVPLAYMRGVTFKDAFIILDEAQNTTPEQIKMFLTRLGKGSKMVVNGDVTQIDLPPKVPSGLIHAKEILQGTPNVAIVEFSSKSIVRHETVQHIIEAYTKHEEHKARKLRC